MPQIHNEIIGYVEKWNVAPGATVPVKVSTNLTRYNYDVVRIIHGDRNPAGPGFKIEEIEAIAGGQREGRVQKTNHGSYGIVKELAQSVHSEGEFSVNVWVHVTARRERAQCVLDCLDDAATSGYRLDIDANGIPVLTLATAHSPVKVAGSRPLPLSHWVSISIKVGGVDKTSATMDVSVRDQLVTDIIRPFDSASTSLAASPSLKASRDLSIAAARIGGGVGDFFNGKVDGLTVTSSVSGNLAGEALRCEFDFAKGIGGNQFTDSDERFSGTLVNSPTRAVTGRLWDGSCLDWTRAPHLYAAVHFHEDDIEDAGWETDIEIDIPDNLPSGAYAVRLTADGATDYVPFFVRPAPGADRAPVLLLMPTFTYLAYANERQPDRIDFYAQGTVDHELQFDSYDQMLRRHDEFGLSIYDVHSDGSGVSLASTKRPVLNVRPDYKCWFHDAPRHLSGDLYIIDWLIEKGIAFDVATDHDLDDLGADLLEGTKVILTGSHPEYVTSSMHDVLARYSANGGNIIYLGGNGFYWVTARTQSAPHLIEVRRGHAGTRTWEGSPGEGYHELTGEPGGLWRYRGKAPNKLVGVGVTASGWDTKATPGYLRTLLSHDPRVAFAFEGMGDEPIGNYGLVLNGAAGDEIDRADVKLGTPPDALVVATTTGHSDYYLIFVEEMMATGKNVTGPTNPDIRADITYFQTGGGGQVFSVGSISFVGSLSHNHYENPLSRMIENVVRHFSK